MWTAWIVLQVVLAGLGSILVWLAIVAAVMKVRERHRARSGRRPAPPSTRPPARLS